MGKCALTLLRAFLFFNCIDNREILLEKLKTLKNIVQRFPFRQGLVFSPESRHFTALTFCLHLNQQYKNCLEIFWANIGV